MATKSENSIPNNREIDITVKLGAFFLSFTVLTIYSALFFTPQSLKLFVESIPGGEMTIGISYVLLFLFGILFSVVGKVITTLNMPEFAGHSLEQYYLLYHHSVLLLVFYLVVSPVIVQIILL